jgi:Rrf2 family protein
MQPSAKADYALRAAVQLASTLEGFVSSRFIARTQQIPAKYLESILAELRHAGLVTSRVGGQGGYALSRPAAEIRLTSP